MITSEEYKSALKIVLAYREQLRTQLEEVENETKDLPRIALTPNTPLIDAVSNRLFNTLWVYERRVGPVFGNPRYREAPLSVLSVVSLSKFKILPRVWKTTVEELQDVCHAAGIELKP